MSTFSRDRQSWATPLQARPAARLTLRVVIAIASIVAVGLLPVQEASASGTWKPPRASTATPDLAAQLKAAPAQRLAQYQAKWNAYTVWSSSPYDPLATMTRSGPMTKSIGPSTMSPNSTIGVGCNADGCPPSSRELGLGDVWEGSSDCDCGPTSGVILLEGYGVSVSIATLHNEMSTDCVVNGTLRGNMPTPINSRESANWYVWQNIADYDPPGMVSASSDLFNMTQIDMWYWFPTIYNIQTYNNQGYLPPFYPLDNYQNLNWKHYFSGDAFVLNGTVDNSYITVSDPHFGAKHAYTARNLMYSVDAIDNNTNQIFW